MMDMLRRQMIVLVADRNMEAAVKGILSRHSSLGICPIATVDIQRHPQKDCGCRVSGVEYLSPFINQYEHALLMFDREGCGQDAISADAHEKSLEQDLFKSGWGDRNAVIVFDPELEIWVWSDSPHVATVLGWINQDQELKKWLEGKGFEFSRLNKPERPKEAIESVLRQVRKPRSSSLYQELAEKVSFGKCSDRAFVKLKETLQKWFPKG